MSELIHKCSQCDSGMEIDCATCKLAALTKKKERRKTGKEINNVEEDDYSISERLTEKKHDYTIFILFAVVLATFFLVILFTKLFNS